MHAERTGTGVRFAALYLRLALGLSFLSAVADRFGLWGPPGRRGVAWGTFENFLSYAASLNPLVPDPLIPALGWGVTIAEIVVGLLLVSGLWTRAAAVTGAVLLLAFGLGMIVGDGLKAPFDASVFSASAGALLLAFHPCSAWSLDAWLARGRPGGEHPAPGA